MKLSDIKMGDSAIIAKVHGTGKFRRRIIEMGFVRGQKVEVLIGAPLKDPIKYKIMDYEVSLRRNEAEFIEVVSINEKETAIKSDNYGTIEYDPISIAKKKGNTINIALVGNPNSGKTSLFNIASGKHEHVGNYTGVTVDAKEGKHRKRIRIRSAGRSVCWRVVRWKKRWHWFGKVFLTFRLKDAVKKPLMSFGAASIRSI